MHESVAGSAPQGQSRTVDPMKAKAKRRLRLEHELAGLSNKALAIGLNTSEAQLTRYEGEQYLDDLPAHKIPALVQEAGPGYMEWLSLQCGGSYTHGTAASADVFQALADGHLDSGERDRLHAHFTKLLHYFQSLEEATSPNAKGPAQTRP